MQQIRSGAHAPPDYTGAEGRRLREAAWDLTRRRNQLKAESQALWQEGDKEGAHQVSVQAKAMDAQVDAAHAKAARVIFAHRNKGKALSFIDVHGLLVREAMGFLEERLASGQATLEIVLSLIHI
eukprot:TRINITY_DN37068_c0_g1_i3.p1 TRINITY_DN37068_c0_g1~~TRINITY_DN37068_c0_g1_i3.p1  ORF type:complete len:125 (-),score=32.53 TRINITY_DN37068_c0_g1_i3:182-556(-)